MATPADIYYQAYIARDHRFDGKFFIGVKTTGIYCRPICPAKPKRENVEFFHDAREAEKAGYRPCLRCRPESAPLSPAWMGRSATVPRALKLIAANALYWGKTQIFGSRISGLGKPMPRFISGRSLRGSFQGKRRKRHEHCFSGNEEPSRKTYFACG